MAALLDDMDLQVQIKSYRKKRKMQTTKLKKICETYPLVE